MNFIENVSNVNELNQYTLLALLVFAVALFSGVFFLCLNLWKNSKKLKFTTIALLTIAGISAVIATVIAFTNDSNVSDSYEVNNHLKIEAIEDTYGLSLTEDDLKELQYPTSIPDQNLEFYGSIPSENISDAELASQSFITLVWSDGELKLIETTANLIDGEELPRV